MTTNEPKQENLQIPLLYCTHFSKEADRLAYMADRKESCLNHIGAVALRGTPYQQFRAETLLKMEYDTMISLEHWKELCEVVAIGEEILSKTPLEIKRQSFTEFQQAVLLICAVAVAASSVASAIAGFINQ